MSMPFSFPMEHVSTTKAFRWCELACISQVAESLVGTRESVGKKLVARALPCAPLGTQRWVPNCWEQE